MEVRSKFDELKKSLPNPLPTPGMLHCYNYISLTSFHCYCSPVSGSGCEGNNNIGYVEPLRLQHHSALHTLIQTNNFHTREMWRHLLVLSHYDFKKRQGNLNKLSASRGFSNMQWRQLVKEPTVSVCVFNIFHENFNFYPTVGMICDVLIHSSLHHYEICGRLWSQPGTTKSKLPEICLKTSPTKGGYLCKFITQSPTQSSPLPFLWS